MMRWPTAMLLAAMFVAGCRRAQPSFDPFLPRTRIPPPATGAATGAPDAYYTNPTPPMTGTAPGWPAPGAAVPSTTPTDLYSPPGGYQYPQPTPAPTAPGPMPVPAPSQPATTSVTPGIGQVPRANRLKYVATADTSRSAVYEAGEQANGAQDSSENPTVGRPAGPSAADEASASRPTIAASRSNRGFETPAQNQPQFAPEDTSSEMDIMDLPPVHRVARSE
ncbi:MAG TPA: hypothetical protein VF278_18380 [Pirellulales bacterium]